MKLSNSLNMRDQGNTNSKQRAPLLSHHLWKMNTFVFWRAEESVLYYRYLTVLPHIIQGSIHSVKRTHICHLNSFLPDYPLKHTWAMSRCSNQPTAWIFLRLIYGFQLISELGFFMYFPQVVIVKIQLIQQICSFITALEVSFQQILEVKCNKIQILMFWTVVHRDLKPFACFPSFSLTHT